MTKICFTSDLHGYFPNIPDCDICCFIGDYQANDREWTNDEYFQELKDRGIITIGVAGNHDYTLYHNEQLGHDTFTHYLYNRSVIVNGIKFFGTPHVLLPNRPFSKTEEELEEIYNNVKDEIKRTDVFLAHQPCFGLADGLFHDGSLINVGSEVLGKYVSKYVPYIFACGHIHEGYGYYKRPSSHYINVSYCDYRNAPRYKVVMYDYETDMFDQISV